MTPRTRSLWVLGHRWAGLVLGLLIVLIGVTGSILIFEDELYGLLNPELSRVEPGETYLPYDVLVAAAAKDYADLQPGYISRLNDADTTPLVVTLQGASSREEKVIVNPYTAEVLGHQSAFSSLALIRRLHADFALGDVGRNAVGILSVLIAILSLVGLVLWWPGKGAWARSLKINWRARPRLMLRDLHNAGGAYVFVFVLLSAITVPPIVWKLTTPGGGPPQASSGPPQASSGPPQAGAAARPGPPAGGAPPGTTTRPPSIPWQQAIDAAQGTVPGQWVGFALRPLGPAPFYMVRLWPPGKVATPEMTTVFVNRYNGDIIRVSSPQAMTPIRMISADFLITLHSGAIAGFPGRLIMFIAGLGFAVLFFSGLATWVMRRSSRASPGHSDVSEGSPES
jgi:uncharacterized iron-regulated membrane protein